MVGILFENESLFNKLGIIKKPKDFNSCQLYTCNDFNFPFNYTVSNSNIFMHTILTQQLADANSNIIIFISEAEGIPKLFNITGIDAKIELPDNPTLIQFNDNSIMKVDIEIRFNSKESGVLYVCTALDIQLMLLMIPKDSANDYIKLNEIFNTKLNLILESEFNTFKFSGLEKADLGYAILNSFEKVADNLVYYAKTIAKTKENEYNKSSKENIGKNEV